MASLVTQVKASACNAGDLGLIPGSGRSPGEGNGNPLQYSCLENPMDGGAWWATVHGVAESDTTSLSLSLSVDVSWFLIVVLTWISLMANELVRLFLLVSHLYRFFEEMSIQVLHPFLPCSFSFCCWVVKFSFSILHVKPLIRYIFCKLFSHYLSCLFTLLILSFDRQNCLSLIESHLSIFFFLAC